jgi:c-di-GMP-binding flagellar brake protein YcgR
MGYSGPERRKHPRVPGRFCVSYRVVEKSEEIDTAQTKNLSCGGMLLTTNRKFSPGTQLVLEIRVPFTQKPIILIGKVLESHEVTKDLIYDTRLEFIAMDEQHQKDLCETLNFYLKKG